MLKKIHSVVDSSSTRWYLRIFYSRLRITRALFKFKEIVNDLVTAYVTIGWAYFPFVYGRCRF